MSYEVINDAAHEFLKTKIVDNIKKYSYLIVFAGYIREQAVFHHINLEDAGLYTCVANTTGEKIDCSVELTVEGTISQMLKASEPPRILAQLTPAESSSGNSAMMELKMKGYPRPNIKWTKDGKPPEA